MAPFNQPLLLTLAEPVPDPDTSRLASAVATVRACEAALAQAVAQLRAVLAEVGIDTPHPIR